MLLLEKYTYVGVGPRAQPVGSAPTRPWAHTHTHKERGERGNRWRIATIGCTGHRTAVQYLVDGAETNGRNELVFACK